MSAPQTKRWVVITLVILDLLAFLFVILAEVKKAGDPKIVSIDNSDGSVTVQCRYKGSSAAALAVFGLLFLTFATALVNWHGGCVCCCGSEKYQQGKVKTWAVVNLVIMWFVFGTAALWLLTGASYNSKHTEDATKDGDLYKCARLRTGVFGVGSAFVLLTMAMSIVYYQSAIKAQYLKWSSTGIQMNPYPPGNPYSLSEPAVGVPSALPVNGYPTPNAV